LRRDVPSRASCEVKGRAEKGEFTFFGLRNVIHTTIFRGGESFPEGFAVNKKLFSGNFD